MNRLRTLFLAAGIVFTPLIAHAETSVAAQEAAAYAKVQTALAKRLPRFNTSGKPLKEVMEELAEVSGINIVIDPEVFEKGGREVSINLNLKDVSVKSVLKVMMRMTGFIADYRDEVLYITTEEEVFAKGAALLTQTYDVRSVITPRPQFGNTLIPGSLQEKDVIDELDPGQLTEGSVQNRLLSDRLNTLRPEKEVDRNGLTLVEMIKRQIEPRSWASDNRVAISYNKGAITVTHIVPIHLSIQRLLKGLEQ